MNGNIYVDFSVIEPLITNKWSKKNQLELVCCESEMRRKGDSYLKSTKAVSRDQKKV